MKSKLIFGTFLLSLFCISANKISSLENCNDRVFRSPLSSINCKTPEELNGIMSNTSTDYSSIPVTELYPDNAVNVAAPLKQEINVVDECGGIFFRDHLSYNSRFHTHGKLNFYSLNHLLNGSDIFTSNPKLFSMFKLSHQAGSTRLTSHFPAGKHEVFSPSDFFIVEYDLRGSDGSDHRKGYQIAKANCKLQPKGIYSLLNVIPRNYQSTFDLGFGTINYICQPVQPKRSCNITQHNAQRDEMYELILARMHSEELFEKEASKQTIVREKRGKEWYNLANYIQSSAALVHGSLNLIDTASKIRNPGDLIFGPKAQNFYGSLSRLPIVRFDQDQSKFYNNDDGLTFKGQSLPKMKTTTQKAI